MKAIKTTAALCVLGCMFTFASGAAADFDDYDSEESSEESSEQADAEGPGEASSSASTSGSVSASGSGVSAALNGDGAKSADEGGIDHDKYVGSFGIGYLGYRTMLVGDAAGGGAQTTEAPVIGLRYWMNSGMGIDAGLGLSMADQTTTTEAGGMSTDTEQPEPLAFILHAGVPLALAKSQHFVFEIVPEMNLGFASNTVDVGGTDVDESGFHLDIGARAGAEIHFGFIDLSELALQAGIGLRYSMDSASVDAGGGNSVSISRSSLGTTVGDNPWNILTANIAALYYFDN